MKSSVVPEAPQTLNVLQKLKKKEIGGSVDYVIVMAAAEIGCDPQPTCEQT